MAIIHKPKRRKIVFAVDAPAAASVNLSGDFNGWDQKTHPMKKNKNGLWQKTVMLFPGRYEYKFLVDGQWMTDSQNAEICQNCFGTVNNVITVSAPY